MRTGLPLFALGLALYTATVTRMDFAADCWWPLAQGAFMASTGRGPEFWNPSFTADSGDPPISNYMLTYVLFHAACRAMGPGGIMVLASWLYAGTFLLVGLVLRRRGAGPVLTASLIFLGHALAWQHMFVRGEAFGFLFFALFLYLLLEEPFAPGTPAKLLALQVLWTNTHATFLLGPILVGLATLGRALDAARPSGAGPDGAGDPAAAAGREAGRLLRLTVFTFLVTGLNRYSFGIYAFHLLHEDVLNIWPFVHWLPPNLNDPEQVWAFPWAVVAMSSLRRHDEETTSRVLAGAFCLAWLLSSRNAVWMILGSIPSIHLKIREAAAGWGDRVPLPRRALAGILTGGLLAGGLIGLAFPRRWYPEMEYRKLADRLADEPAIGGFLNEYIPGGFLSWYPAGDHRLFIDPGMARYVAGGILADYVTVLHARPGWDEVLEVYDIRYALLFEWRLLTRLLLGSGEWEVIAEQMDLVLLRRRPVTAASGASPEPSL